MIIQTDDHHNIESLITVGGDPTEPNCYVVDYIPPDIMFDIFSYKYINGQFILKTDTDEKHIHEAQEQKISFLSKTCQIVIESGIQVGDDHYSLSYTDQINLSKLASQAVMVPQLPIFYHADGKLCRQYTPEEILMIAQLSVNWVTYHTTYFNFAKAYIRSLTNFEEIRPFAYGMELSDELEEQMETITQTTGVTYTETVEDPFNYDQILYPNRDILPPTNQ